MGRIESTLPNTTAKGLVHLDYLDSLRGLAALYVVGHHALYSLLPNYSLLGVFAFGGYAVQLFIILSGFCLMLPVTRRNGTLTTSTRDFFIRRAWRILPTYYIALLVCILWNFTLRADRQTISPWDVAFHFLMIHDAVPAFANSINSVFWSIGVEWRIYFFFPLLIMGWKLFGRFKITFVTIAFSMFGAAALGIISPSNLTNMSFHFLGLFCMGMLAADLCFSTAEHSPYWPSQNPNFWHGVAAASMVGIVAISWYDPITRWPYRPTTIATAIATGFLGAVLLVCITYTRSSAIWSFLRAKPLVSLGKFSYSLYLVHTVILSTTYTYLIDPFGLSPLPRGIAGALIGTFLSIAGAYLFFLVAERPFLKAGRRKPLPRDSKPIPEEAVASEAQVR